jgi:hypothetical protein
MIKEKTMKELYLVEYEDDASKADAVVKQFTDLGKAAIAIPRYVRVVSNEDKMLLVYNESYQETDISDVVDRLRLLGYEVVEISNDIDVLRLS